jgi:hypothetical protein
MGGVAVADEVHTLETIAELSVGVLVERIEVTPDSTRKEYRVLI